MVNICQYFMIFVNIRYCKRTYFAYSAYIFHICAYSAYICLFCLFCLYLYPFCLLEQPTPLKVPPAYATQGPNSLRHSRSHRWAGPATCPGTPWLPPRAVGNGHYVYIYPLTNSSLTGVRARRLISRPRVVAAVYATAVF